MSIVPTNWFSASPEHSLLGKDGKPQPHMFFDMEPELIRDDRYINTFITTPENSEHSYSLDMNSGQRYYSHSYCSQKDVWSQQSGSFNRPKFSIGVIPRTLDQIGEPQKVIIFGGQDVFTRNLDIQSHQIKLFGAYVEQICFEGNCLGRNNWVSHLVLLGVYPEDQKVGMVNDANDFSKIYEWNEMKAHLENLDGRNSIGEFTYPGVKIGQIIGLVEAMNYYKKRSIYLSEKESKKIQQGCFSLYEKMWEDVGKSRPEDKPSTTIADLNEKLKLKKEMKAKGLPFGFAARFIKFSQKYHKEAATCDKFVYHGNINNDPEKFWFLSYMEIFYRLNKDGYYFDCGNKTWHRNHLNAQGLPVYNLKKEISLCSDRDIDTAMTYLPNFLNGLKGSDHSYYRFADYDTHSFGTHRKLYSWLKVKSRKYDCSTDPNIQIRKEINIFPENISWTKREIVDIANKMKIIE